MAARPQQRLHVTAREPPARHQRDREAGADGYDGRDCQHASVYHDLVDAAKIDRRRANEEGKCLLGDQDPQCPASQRQYELLDDHEPDQPGAAGAKSTAQRRFAQPAERARQRQVREIGARHQQQARDRAEQQHQT